MSRRHFCPGPSWCAAGEDAQPDESSLASAAAPLPALGASPLPGPGLPHCYRKRKTKQMKRNLPQNNPSASWHRIRHRKFCESETLGRKRPISSHGCPSRGMGEGEVSARLSPPACFGQASSDGESSLGPTDRPSSLGTALTQQQGSGSPSGLHLRLSTCRDEARKITEHHDITSDV